MKPSPGIRRVEERLRRGGVTYRVGPERIEVSPSSSDGFTVGLLGSAAPFTVYFDGWHEDFATEEEALNCFTFGLSGGCRLRVEYRGRTPVKWTVQSREQTGEWVGISVVGMLLVPFWRPKRIVHLRNGVLEARRVER
jgi:hypothetical protein